MHTTLKDRWYRTRYIHTQFIPLRAVDYIIFHLSLNKICTKSLLKSFALITLGGGGGVKKCCFKKINFSIFGGNAALHNRNCLFLKGLKAPSFVARILNGRPLAPLYEMAVIFRWSEWCSSATISRLPPNVTRSQGIWFLTLWLHERQILCDPNANNPATIRGTHHCCYADIHRYMLLNITLLHYIIKNYSLCIYKILGEYLW